MLHELFCYDALTGIFTRRVVTGTNTYVGQVLGSVDAKGYLTFMVSGKQRKAHRMAWLYVHGTLPEVQIDHKNLVKSDNWIDNLRLATNTQNCLNQGVRSNNSSGVPGVTWSTACDKWVARCSNGKGARVYLGAFDSLSLAAEARKQFAETHHAEFYKEQSCVS